MWNTKWNLRDQHINQNRANIKKIISEIFLFVYVTFSFFYVSYNISFEKLTNLLKEVNQEGFEKLNALMGTYPEKPVEKASNSKTLPKLFKLLPP